MITCQNLHITQNGWSVFLWVNYHYDFKETKLNLKKRCSHLEFFPIWTSAFHVSLSFSVSTGHLHHIFLLLEFPTFNPLLPVNITEAVSIQVLGWVHDSNRNCNGSKPNSYLENFTRSIRNSNSVSLVTWLPWINIRRWVNMLFRRAQRSRCSSNRLGVRSSTGNFTRNLVIVSISVSTLL